MLLITAKDTGNTMLLMLTVSRSRTIALVGTLVVILNAIIP